MLIDYPTLRFIWWILLGTLLVGFAIMDGFDLGIGILLHQVAKTNNERRVVLNTIGPVWEGNQVWLVLGGGAIFAAWPLLYAVSFSGFYLPMFIILLGLILRPVGFKYRSKIEHTHWRRFWDLCLFIGGLLPALIFGVAIGNVLQGVPFYFDLTLRTFYLGTFWQLLNPFALICGLVSVTMMIQHGAVFLCIKTTGLVQKRAKKYAYYSAGLTILLFTVAGYLIAYKIPGYQLLSLPHPSAPSNPLYKQVVMQAGAWLNNYRQFPITRCIPIIGLLSPVLVMLLISIKKYRCAWLGSALTIASLIGTVGCSMFPFILPSSLKPNMSLLVWDASSSQTTLFIMLIASAVFLPIIMLYTSWIYYVLRGKVTPLYIEQNSHSTY